MKHFYISHEFTFPSGFGMCSKLLSLILSMSLSRSVSLAFTLSSVLNMRNVKMRIQRRLIHSDVQPSTSFQFDPIRFFPPLARRFTETFAPIIRHTSVQMNECFRVWDGIKACDVMWVCVCQTSAYHFWACQLTAPSTFIQNISSIRFSRWKEKQW